MVEMEADAVGGFNPRSPPKRGATSKAPNCSEMRTVSTHAPLLREERPDPRACRCCSWCFNPRSPPKRGATKTVAIQPRNPLFQPTLPS
mgnify:CR=1 FL=1